MLNLHDSGAADAALVGGKAASLHRLAAAGAPVPEAFVITTAAFRAHLPDAIPGRRPEPPALTDALAGAIATAVRALLPDEIHLVVRSSALAEDAAGASFAGQHDSYYYIAPDDLPRAVVACWLSLWSAPAERYRAEHGDRGGIAMAVMVQRMVQAERAGVCFTDDPTGRHPGYAWLEATWGLGAALVDGRVSPDRLLLDRQGRVERRQVGRKRHKVAAGLRAPGETRLEPVPAFQQTLSVLDDRTARRILTLSLEAEALFGSPQDVEWAMQGDELFVLQSRPIGTPGMATAELAPAPPGRWVLFKPLAENFTEPLTPLTVDLFRRVLPPFGRFVGGHYYLNLNLLERLCPFRWSSRELIDAALLRGPVPTLRLRWWKAPLAALGLAGLYLLDGPSWHRSARLSRASLAPYAALCWRLSRDPAVAAPAALQRLITGGSPFEPIGRRAYYLNISAGRYFLLMGVLNKLVNRYAPDLDRDLLHRLCSGDGATFSRQMVERVRELAEVARDDPALCEQLGQADSRDLAGQLATLDPAHPFMTALQDFLARFGHRCMREMELATPRWREDAVPLLLMVRSYLRAPADRVRAEQAPEDGREALRRAFPGAWQRRLADYLVNRVRYYVSLREDTRYYHAMAMEVARSKLLDLERTLLAKGRLRVPGDLFYLTWDEARALAGGRLGRQDASARIRQRRRQRHATARHGPAAVLGVAGAAAGTPTTSSEVALHGQCASPGAAEGRARIVLDPATVQDIEPGDILIAPYTDPAWTPLFPLVGAVVVEIGSFLSHAGTVAREYGIPCLVDVTDCTRLLRDGQRVRVLAGEGRLEVCEP